MISTANTPDDRAVSPVVAVALLLAITVVLTAAVFPIAMSAATGQQEVTAQDIQIEFVFNGGTSQSTDDSFDNSGNDVNGDGLVKIQINSVAKDIEAGQIAVTGVTSGGDLADETSLYTADEDLATADTITVWMDSAEKVSLIWHSEDSEHTEILASYSLPDTSGSLVAAADDNHGAVTLPDGVLFTGTSNGIRRISGDAGTTDTIGTSVEPTGLGPATDIDADGTIEVPYVDNNHEIRMVTTDGDETLLADSLPGGETIQRSETRLAVGTWDGSDRSVFFANENEDILYRVTPDGTVTEVATPTNGPSGVIGPHDIDGDSDDEMLYIGSSDDIRYLEDGGTDSVLYSNAGQDSGGVGGGSTADYDDDGASEVGIVDGGNYIVLSEPSGDFKVESSDVVGPNAPQANKAPVTSADVDNDGTPELVYVATDGYLNYLDDIEQGAGNIEILDLLDASGNEITGDGETGTV